MVSLTSKFRALVDHIMSTPVLRYALVSGLVAEVLNFFR